MRNVDGLIKEGFATWAAGEYWLEWQGFSSFLEATRTYIDDGVYITLHENPFRYAGSSGEDCLELRDRIYTEWAGFVEFLLSQYGEEKFEVLFNLATDRFQIPNMPGRTAPDYIRAYGKSLEQLEAEWIESISLEQ